MPAKIILYGFAKFYKYKILPSLQENTNVTAYFVIIMVTAANMAYYQFRFEV